MKNVFAAGVLTVAALAGSSEGAMVSYSNSVPLQTTNWGVPVALDVALSQWDPALFPGQTLVGVTLKLTGFVTGDVEAESLDNAPADVSLNVSAIIVASGPSGLVVQVIPLANAVLNATGYDGTTDFAGTSGASYLGLSNNAMNSSSLINPPDDLSPYIGAGTFNVAASGTGASSGSGAGNLLAQFATQAGVDLEITYTYVPAPATAGLLCLGLLAARRRR